MCTIFLSEWQLCHLHCGKQTIDGQRSTTTKVKCFNWVQLSWNSWKFIGNIFNRESTTMSNPFGQTDDDREGVLEGFLCPICKEDLRSPDRLTAHVQSVHSEEQDLMKSFKDIFITAKKKIKYFDDNGSASPISNDSIVKAAFSSPKKINIPPPVYPQDIGTDFSHFQYFKAIQ